MKNLSLKKKIYFIALAPFILFLITVTLVTKESYQKYLEAERLSKQNITISISSDLLHHLQKERGLSASFLSGGATLDKLQAHYKETDKLLEKTSLSMKDSQFTENIKKQVLRDIASVKGIRGTVLENKNSSLPAVLKSYTKVVFSLLDMQSYVSNSTSFISTAKKIQTYRLLEDAKEAGGKLRANISMVVAADGPISRAKLSQISNLKTAVILSLSSSGLALNDKLESMIANFLNSSEWKSSLAVYDVVEEKYREGSYNQNPDQFFKTISEALGYIDKAIIYKSNDINSDIEKHQSNAVRNLWTKIALLLFSFICGSFFLTKFTGSLISSIESLINELKQGSNDLEHSSLSIATQSQQLSEASYEQASSLQETVSSISEISSMVEKNADSSISSSQLSESSQKEATTGSENINKMLRSIKEISSGNDQLREEMHQTTEEISSISSMIQDIGEKTKVINDIVFQTKLLSFNASVEAARAGEHGKGFAVVAEEVGNLASMSGQAANEISALLDSSTKRVEEIVSNSKSKVESLVSNSKVKTDEGIKIAQECKDSLDKIQENVTSVSNSVKEIAHASNEQASGIQEINNAMQELDQVTNQNTTSARESSDLAREISEQSNLLTRVVEDLVQIIDGEESRTPTPKRSPGAKKAEAVETTKNSTPSAKVIKMVKKKPEVRKEDDPVDSNSPDIDDDRFQEL